MENNNHVDGFGEARDDAGDRFRFFQLVSPNPDKGEERTELVVRLLPSMKSYKDTGKWNFYHGVHYGYKGVNKRKPDSPRARPFGCIQQKTGDKITQVCPKCEQIAAFAKRAKALEGATEPAKVAQHKALTEWLKAHNLDKKVYINVMAYDGSFGVLKLSWKAFTALRTLISQIGIGAATSLHKAPWLKFTRTGQKLAVIDSVSKYQETVVTEDGEEVSKTIFSSMTPEQCATALRVCPDLTKIVNYISYDKIEQLVKCSGEPRVVDEIFDGPKEEEPTATESAASDDTDYGQYGPEADPQLPAWAGPTPDVAAPPPAPFAAEVAEEDEEAVLQAKMEALRAKKAAAATSAKKAATTSAPTTADDFLAKFQPKV
jgi:hypothetical protein